MQLPDAQATLERNERYRASLRGENELHCGPSMAAWALEESNDLIAAMALALALPAVTNGERG